MDIDKKHISFLKQGSYISFTFMYNKYVGALYSFVFGLIHDREITKDIIQETFLRIWQKKENIDENQKFRNYIFTIAYNILVNELRKKVNNALPIDAHLEECSITDIEEESEHNSWRLMKIKFAKRNFRHANCNFSR